MTLIVFHLEDFFPRRFLENEKNKFRENFKTISKCHFGNVFKGFSFGTPQIHLEYLDFK